MADDPKREMFRKKSLERLSSPERLDQLLHVVDRKSWVPLVSVALLIFSLLAWAIFGWIPINVEGQGILVRPRRIAELQSPGDGRLLSLHVSVDDLVEDGDLLATIARPDLEEQLRTQIQKHDELAAEIEAAEIPLPEIDGSRVGSSRPAGRSLRDHIERSRALALSLHQARMRILEEDLARLDEQKSVALELRDSLAHRLETHRQFYGEQLVSKIELDNVEESYVESLERLFDVETQRGALATAKLEADEEYLDRVQRIAEWNFELQHRIGDARREISRLRQLLKQETEIVSEGRGRIIEVSSTPGSFLEAGDRIGAMEILDEGNALKSITYFLVKDGKRLHEEMPVLITPDTVERERHGSMKGVIESISDLPVTPEEATNVVGNRILAESLIQGGYLIQVSSRLLTREEDPEAYEWTSSMGAGVRVTAGTTASARVAVEREHPIHFVFPLIKSATGIE